MRTPGLGRSAAADQPAGLQAGVPVAVAVGVGVGLGQPPPVTLTSTEVVVLVPVYPPTATALLPISVPAGNERCWFRVGPLVQLLVAGSNICRVFVVSGVNSRLSHAPTPPLLPALGIVSGPLNGLPPPNTHSLPPITAEPGTLTPLGMLARVVHVLATMS